MDHHMTHIPFDELEKHVTLNNEKNKTKKCLTPVTHSAFINWTMFNSSRISLPTLYRLSCCCRTLSNLWDIHEVIIAFWINTCLFVNQPPPFWFHSKWWGREVSLDTALTTDLARQTQTNRIILDTHVYYPLLLFINCTEKRVSGKHQRLVYYRQERKGQGSKQVATLEGNQNGCKENQTGGCILDTCRTTRSRGRTYPTFFLLFSSQATANSMLYARNRPFKAVTQFEKTWRFSIDHSFSRPLL